MSGNGLDFYIGTEVVKTESDSVVQTANKRKLLGERCAELYIAAQGVCQKTSDTACDLAESKKGDAWFKRGFNERMAKTPYAGRMVD